MPAVPDFLVGSSVSNYFFIVAFYFLRGIGHGNRALLKIAPDENNVLVPPFVASTHARRAEVRADAFLNADPGL